MSIVYSGIIIVPHSTLQMTVNIDLFIESNK